MIITLLDESGPIGEVGSDLIEADWDAGTLMLKGDSPLVRHLMRCRQDTLTVIADGRHYTVQRHHHRYADDEWTSTSELKPLP